jgi:hypothetical protein
MIKELEICFPAPSPKSLALACPRISETAFWEITQREVPFAEIMLLLGAALS